MSRKVKDTGKFLSPIANGDDRTTAQKGTPLVTLPDSDGNYRLVIESASQGIVIAQENTIRYANPKVTEFTGFTREELTSRPFIELIHPDDRQIVIRYHEDVLLRKVPSRQLHHRIIDKEGRVKWMEVTGVPFTWEDAPSTLLFISDITERKGIEDRLRQSEEKYRELIEHTGDLIYIMDGHGNFKFINQTMESEYGHYANDLLGKGFRDLITPESYSTAADIFKKQLKGIDVGSVEYELYDRNGRIKTIETKERLVWEGNRIVEVYGIARDVTDRKRAEEALKESEEKYRLVVENAAEVIIVAVEGYLKLYNKKTAEVFGYSEEELISTPIIEFFHPDDRELVLSYRSKREKDKTKPQFFTARMLIKGGATVWMENSVVPFAWRGKRADLVIATDITERKRIEDALRESDEKYRLVVENADEIIGVTTDGILQFVNRKALALFGYAENELVGTPAIDHVHPDDRLPLLRHWRKIGFGKEKNRPFVMRFIGKDGNVIWTENSIVPIQWQGKVAAINIATDITERKRIEDALKESEEKYRLVVENADEIITVSVGGILRLVNKKAVALSSYSEDELLGMPSIELIHPDDRHLLLDHRRKLERGETPPPLTMRALGKDGAVYWTESSIVPIQWQGEAAAINIATDITERKRIGDALKESEEKYRLLIENASEGIAITQDRMTRFVNPMLSKLVDYSTEEVMSRSFIDFVHPDDRQMVLDHHIKRTTLEEEPTPYIFRAVSRTGNVVWLETSAVIIDWEGRPASLSFLRNITEQKKIEDALRESEEKYRLVVENANEIIVITRDGIVQFANNRVMTLFGVPPSILFGKHLSELVIGKDREMLREELGKILTGEEILPYYRYRMRDAKGGIRYIEVNGIPIAWEGQSSLLSFVSDITDRVNAERALQESEAFIRGLVENAPLGILYLDREGTITYENPMSWIITTGMFDETRPSRAVGMNVYDLPGIRDYPESKDVIDKLLSGQSVSNYTLPFTSITGKQTILSVSGAPRIGSDDMLVGAVVQISDITDKVRAEDEIRRRLHYEEALAFCSRELVPLTDLERPMQTIVQHLLDKLDVGGVFICENVMDPIEGLSMLTIAEAIADGYKTPTDLPIPDRFAYKCRSPEMFETLSKGRWYGGPTKDYPPVDRNLLTLIGSRSSITIPIFVTDSFWGFIGFDDYETERVWDEQDILLLQTLSSIIGTAIARKEAKDALAESERRYRELVDSTNDMIYVADYRGTLKYVNAAVRRLGYEPEDLIGKNVYEFYAPSSMEYAQELFRLERTGHQLKSYELDVVRKDGQVRTIEFREDLKWEGDRIVEVYGIGRDVTDRKKMENRLRLVAGSQEAVLNSLRDMVFFTDMTLKITWANRAASQVTGLSIEELVGRFCYEVLHKEDAPCDGCPAIASLSTGRVEKNDSLSCVGKNRRITAYPIPDVLGATSGIAVSIGGLKSRNLFEITEGLSQLDDDIEEDGSSELFLAPLDPNYIYPFSLSIDLQKDTFLITLGWDQYPNEHLLKRLARSESAVARFVYLAARMKTDATGWVDKDVIKAGTMDTNLNKLRSLLEESNVPFLDRFSSRMLIRSDREKKIRLALSASNIEISPGIRNFRSKKHRYMEAVTKRIKTLEREMKKSNQPKEYLISELAIQRQNEANLKKSIEVVETLIGRSLALLKF